MNIQLERKARHYRELARQITDEAARAEIIRLAAECETAAAEMTKSASRLESAA